MNQIDQAVLSLNNGGVVIFPTDTAFGIGCRIDKLGAIQKLFAIRKRPVTQAVSLLVDSGQMAEKYWSSPLPDIVRRMMKTHWPGGLTIVYTANIDLTPPLVRGSGTTIGIRMPDHPVILELIRRVGVPILGPSANFHGSPTPFSFDELDPELTRLVDFVLEGKCKTSLASTVIDCTREPIKILRQGSVNIKLYMEKDKITLSVDTTDSTKTVIVLKRDEETLSKKIEKTDPQTKSQNILPLIELVLKEHNLKLSDLKSIEVNPGPGSFTGVRVGVSVANALGWVLGIPVNGKKIEFPTYEKSKFD